MFLSYDQTERMLAALLDKASVWRPDPVGIARRAGPGTMIACMMALPLAMIGWDRATQVTSLDGPPAEGRRILLVDDCCATGRTMFSVRSALIDRGFAVATMTIVHDPDTTRFVPDYSHPMRELFRFPWERGERRGRGLLRATGAPADRRPPKSLSSDWTWTACSCRTCRTPDYAADLAKPCVAATRWTRFPSCPRFAPERAVVITARPEMDRVPTEAWLARWATQGCAWCAARRKCRTTSHRLPLQGRGGNALGLQIVESEAEQAIRIAAVRRI